MRQHLKLLAELPLLAIPNPSQVPADVFGWLGTFFFFYTVTILVQTASMVELKESQRILTPSLWSLRVIFS